MKRPPGAGDVCPPPDVAIGYQRHAGPPLKPTPRRSLTLLILTGASQRSARLFRDPSPLTCTTRATNPATRNKPRAGATSVAQLLLPFALEAHGAARARSLLPGSAAWVSVFSIWDAGICPQGSATALAPLPEPGVIQATPRAQRDQPLWMSGQRGSWRRSAAPIARPGREPCQAADSSGSSTSTDEPG